MNRYSAVLERVIAGPGHDTAAARRTVYDRARAALCATLDSADDEDARSTELGLLEAAAAALERAIGEGRFVPGGAKPDASAKASPDPSPGPPLRPPHRENLPRSEAGLSLFSQNTVPADSADGNGQDFGGAATGTLVRLRTAFGLALLAVGIGVWLALPASLRGPDPARFAVPAPPPQALAKVLGDLRWTGEGQAGSKAGAIAWTREPDPAAAVPRAGRVVLVGRADLRPLAPPAILVFGPDGDDAARALLVMELRFEAGGPQSVAAVQTFKLALPGAAEAEPEGVIIRTGPQGFAFVFSNAANDAALNAALLAQAEGLVIGLQLDDGSPARLAIATVRLE